MSLRKGTDMILAFERRVTSQYIDLDKMAADGKIDREIEGSSNGYYPVVIVPEYLIGRRIVILPLSDDGTPLEVNMKEKIR